MEGVQPQGKEKPVVLVLVLAVLAISWASIFVRWCGAVPASVIAFYRLFWSGFLMGAWALRSARGWPPELEGTGLIRHGGWLLVSGLMLALHFASWIAAVQTTTIAHALVLGSTHPVFTLLIAPHFLKESSRWQPRVAAVLTLAGVVLISGQDFFRAPPRLAGDLLAVVSALFVSIYVQIARRVRHQFSLRPYLFVVYGTAALVLVVVNLGTGTPLVGYPPQAHFWMLMLALIPTGVGHSLINWAARHLEAHKVNFAILGEPVIASLLAYWLFAEQPAGWFFPGAALILGGIALALSR
ncbi:MAG: DMT family transporter [Calditrichaeota bacterium]|nr:MAG: DMT family transporter [Calditrichota bacterium]